MIGYFYEHMIVPQLMLIAIFILCLSNTYSIATTTYDGASQFVPLGVYMSWERTAACAKYYKTDRWNDVCKRLDVIAKYNIDTLWVANMTEGDLPRLIKECKVRNLKLIAAMNTVETKISSQWTDNGKYYDSVIPRIVKLANKSKTLIGWVLSDEPRIDDLPKIEKLRLKFSETDPDRFSLVVTTWNVTPYVPEHTNLPIVCVDLYPFFGHNDPNGPHTEKTSKAFFRKNTQRMIDAIGSKNIMPWIMSQCFVEIWGPWRYNENYQVIALPGAYLHWRCPTLAEIRWQIWETFRSGCKGAFVFTITPPAPNPTREKLPPPKNFPYKNVLIKAPVVVGPAGLLSPDASPTLQLKELSKAYRTIAKHKQIIRRWKQISLSGVTVSKPGKIQCFIDPVTKNKYAIILNDDLRKAHKLKLTLSKNDTRIFTLQAGDGTIIELNKQN